MPIARLASRAVLLAALVLIPLPAAAHDKADGDVARRLSDPSTQLAVTTMLTALSEAALNLPIEPVARAVRAAGADDAVADLPPNARLRDLASRDGDRLPAELGRNVPRMMDRAATLAGAMEGMMPQLRAMGRQMRDAIPPELDPPKTIPGE